MNAAPVNVLVVVALHQRPVVKVDPEPDRFPPVSAVVTDDHAGDLALGGGETQAVLRRDKRFTEIG